MFYIVDRRRNRCNPTRAGAGRKCDPKTVGAGDRLGRSVTRKSPGWITWGRVPRMRSRWRRTRAGRHFPARWRYPAYPARPVPEVAPVLCVQPTRGLALIWFNAMRPTSRSPCPARCGCPTELGAHRCRKSKRGCLDRVFFRHAAQCASYPKPAPSAGRSRLTAPSWTMCWIWRPAARRRCGTFSRNRTS